MSIVKYIVNRTLFLVFLVMTTLGSCTLFELASRSALDPDLVPPVGLDVAVHRVGHPDRFAAFPDALHDVVRVAPSAEVPYEVVPSVDPAERDEEPLGPAGLPRLETQRVI